MPSPPRIMPSPLVLHLLLITLAFIRATHGSPPDHHTLTTTTGRRVAQSVFLAHPLAKPGRHADQLVDFSVHTGHLTGRHLSLNLRTSITHKSILHTPSSITISLNGIPHPSSFSAIVHTAPHFEAVYPAGDSYPASITTPDGRELVPLHAARHPGLYIRASLAPRARRVDLSDDVQTPPPPDAAVVEEVQNETIVPSSSTSSVSAQGLLSSMDDAAFELVSASRAAATSGQCSQGDGARILELAMAFDNSLCARYGTLRRVVAKLLQTVAKGNEAFARGLCVRMELTHVDAHCNDSEDPYEALRMLQPKELFNRLALFWFTSRTDVPRDAAVFVSGFSDGTRTAGVAVVAGACSRLKGISWIEGLDDRVLAHEVGHLLGAKHSKRGLMAAVLTKSTPRWFSKLSIGEMRKFLETDQRSSCITKNRLRCEKKTCLGKCLGDVCVTGTVKAKPASDTPSTTASPRLSDGTCAKSFTRARPPACLGRKQLQLILFTTGAIAVPYLSIQFGKVRMEFMALSGSISVSVGIGIGSVPTKTFKPKGVGNTAVYEREIGELTRPSESGRCCEEKIVVRAILSSCEARSCNRINATYSTRLQCPLVCSGKGNALGMTASRRCPRCA